MDLLLNAVNRELTQKRDALQDKVDAQNDAYRVARMEYDVDYGDLRQGRESTKKLQRQIEALESDFMLKENQNHVHNLAAEIGKLSKELQTDIPATQKSLVQETMKLEGAVDRARKALERTEAVNARKDEDVFATMLQTRAADDALQSLGEAVEQRRATVQALHNKIQFTEDRIREVRSAMDDERLIALQVKLEVNGAIEAADEGRKQLAETLKQLEESKTRGDDVEEEALQLQEELSAVRHEVDQSRELAARLRAQERELVDEVGALEKLLEKERLTGNERRNGMQFEQQKGDDIHHETRRMQQLVQLAEQQKYRLADEVKVLRDTKQRMLIKFHRLHEKAAELRQRGKTVDGVAEDIEDDNKAYEQAIAALQKESDLLMQDIDSQLQQQHTMLSTLKSLQGMQRDLERKQALLTGIIKQQEGELAKLERQRATIDDAAGELRAEQATTASHLQAKLQEVSEVRSADRDRKKADIERLRAVLLRVEKAGRNARDAVDSAARNLRAAASYEGGLVKGKDDMVTEIHQLKAEADALMAEMQRNQTQRGTAHLLLQNLEQQAKKLHQRWRLQEDGLEAAMRERTEWELEMRTAEGELVADAEALRAELRFLDDDRRLLLNKFRGTQQQEVSLKNRCESLVLDMQRAAGLTDDTGVQKHDPNLTPEEVQAQFLMKRSQDRARLQEEGDQLDQSIVKAEKELKLCEKALKILEAERTESSWERAWSLVPTESAAEQREVEEYLTGIRDELVAGREQAEATRLRAEIISWESAADERSREYVAAYETHAMLRQQLTEVAAQHREVYDQVAAERRRSEKVGKSTVTETRQTAAVDRAKRVRLQKLASTPGAPEKLKLQYLQDTVEDITAQLHALVVSKSTALACPELFFRYRQKMDARRLDVPDHTTVAAVASGPPPAAIEARARTGAGRRPSETILSAVASNALRPRPATAAREPKVRTSRVPAKTTTKSVSLGLSVQGSRPARI